MNQAVEIPNDEIARRDESLSDCTPHQLAEERYMRALTGMVEHAAANRHFELLVDKLTATLASIGLHYGPGVTGDILAKFGGHLVEVAERQRAEERGRAGEEGRLQATLTIDLRPSHRSPRRQGRPVLRQISRGCPPRLK